MSVENISAILLAAGLSRRMGSRDKLLLEYKGMALIEHAINLLDSLPCREKILVTSPRHLEGISLPAGIATVLNQNPQAGQSESLRLGLGAATGQWYLFLNADQPRLELAALLPFFELSRTNQGKIIYPTVEGNPCSPTLFPASFREELLAQTGDAGGRAVRAAHPQVCLAFETDIPEDFADIDGPQDYSKLTTHTNR
ncbi:MAG: nucleotidyltransferase family protein [Oscillospiraceae bacterium]|nr:nucleotidyltransferase family protein [Oscillospiraceae bacterium]